MSKITLQDTMDYVAQWHFGPLSESEQHAIHEVCAYGATYGYGNMISWLNTAWAIYHVNKMGVTPEAAAKMVHGTPYPLPKRKE